MYPNWIYVVVAALIALVAFGIGQFSPGFGVMFAAGASLAWTAHSATRSKCLRS